MTLLCASHICVTLTGTEVLHDVSLRIDAGEIVTIVGPNGSGKSTLLRALLGILQVTHGSVTQSPGLRIGYVPQRLQIDRTLPLTVRRFLSLPTRRTTTETAEGLARTGVPGVAQKQMTDLSGGQLQRVLLARALLTKPDLLILDEPTQGLDQPGEAAFYRLIEEVRRETGVAVLMVSHDLHVVMSASDRVICLNGHVCCEGTPLVVSNAPEYRALFGLGTQGALALYQHDHDHDHTHTHDHPTHDHSQGQHQGHADDPGHGPTKRDAPAPSATTQDNAPAAHGHA
jgi:zinc transport system ATP-binding protein